MWNVSVEDNLFLGESSMRPSSSQGGDVTGTYKIDVPFLAGNSIYYTFR